MRLLSSGLPWLWSCLASLAVAAIPAIRAGESVTTALRALQGPELGFIYTSELVPDSLQVLRSPTSSDAVAVARELLAPHALELRLVAPNLYAVARSADVAVTAAATPAEITISEIVVSASRYQLRDATAVRAAVLAGSQLQSQPGLGEDALRGISRIPGVVQNSLSANSFVRGGDRDETLVLLDGFPLRQAYHLPGYQSLFSLIDPALIATAEVFTGGFPARYGDRMSAVFDLKTIDAAKLPRRALGLSFFNASARGAGDWSQRHDGDWLAMGRVGTLRALIAAINPEVGLPTYGDAYARARLRHGTDQQWSLNGLYSRDALRIADAEGGESGQLQSSATYLWLRGAQHWGERLSLNSWLGYSQIEAQRNGALLLPDISGEVRDRRDARLWDLRARLEWLINTDQQLETGIEWTRGAARYDYMSGASFGAPISALFGRPATTNRRIAVRPQRTDVAAYFSHRWRISPRFATEVGMRARRIVDVNEPALDLLEPRLAVRLAAGAQTALRFAWGQFHQQDGIHELRIADGVGLFGEPQRSDHLIAGIEHQYVHGPTIRTEIFFKQQVDPRPRYENQLNTLAILPELAADRIAIAPDHSELRGVELSAEMNGHPWSWWANYVWSESFDDITGSEVPRAWDQRHALSGGIEWQRGAWSISAIANLHTGWPTSQLVTDAAGTVKLTTRNSARLATFGSLDLRAGWQRSYSPGTLTLALELTNALDHENPCCRRLLLSTGGAGNAPISTRQLNWLPILPALSVLWEF